MRSLKMTTRGLYAKAQAAATMLRHHRFLYFQTRESLVHGLWSGVHPNNVAGGLSCVCSLSKSDPPLCLANEGYGQAFIKDADLLIAVHNTNSTPILFLDQLQPMCRQSHRPYFPTMLRLELLNPFDV